MLSRAYGACGWSCKSFLKSQDLRVEAGKGKLGSLRNAAKAAKTKDAVPSVISWMNSNAEPT